MLTYLLFALAVSIDGLGVGLAYGMNGEDLPPRSFVLIGSLSFISMVLSIFCGNFICSLVSDSIGLKIGPVLMIIVGFMVLRRKQFQNNKGFSNIAQVADNLTGSSSEISGKTSLTQSFRLLLTETLPLGLALAVDSFASGISAGVSGLAPLAAAFLVGVTQVLLLKAGVIFGSVAANIVELEVFSLIPGYILVVLGLIRILN